MLRSRLLYHLKALLFLTCLLLINACTTSRVQNDAGLDNDHKIDFIILQLNDVYEIAPLSGGTVGGMARVAHVKNTLLRENPRVITVLAGDFLNPSLLGTIKVDGERVRGKQMVEVMNAMGVDLVVFGNHEFDLDREDLQKRINESNAVWLGTNLRQVCGEVELPFHRESEGEYQFVADEKVWTLKDDDGTIGRIGFFGACLDSNPRDYVKYYNTDSCAALSIQKLEANSDLLIGLTHQYLEDDVRFLKAFTNVPLIMGGHEHENHFETYDGRSVAKADANAKSVYIHRISLNTENGNAEVDSELKYITDEIPDDPVIKPIVDKWQRILNEEITQIVNDPYEVIYTSAEQLDGREITNRQIQTNMGDVFTRAMKAAAHKEVDAAIINSGSFRVDDKLDKEIRPIDLFRTLPFGGGIVEVDMKGSLLLEVLEASERSKGIGAYLQRSEDITQSPDKKSWLIGGNPIDSGKTYHIILTDFLLLGYDIPILTADHPGISKVDRPGSDPSDDLRADIRSVIIHYLEEQ